MRTHSPRYPEVHAAVRFTHPVDVDPTPEVTPAALCGEIAARLIEWGEVGSRAQALAWLVQLVQIAKVSPNALWLYLSYQTGDTAAISRSFQMLGEDSSLPKQAVHQNTVKALEKLRDVCPELAEALTDLYVSHRPESGNIRAKVKSAAQKVADVAAENILGGSRNT
jgi:hypothetical protein